MHHCVYILYSEKLDKYYIGSTQDLDTRLSFHNNPIESRKFTSRGVPWILRLSIKCSSKEEAMILEKYIKNLKSRKYIEVLINSTEAVGAILLKIRTPNQAG